MTNFNFNKINLKEFSKAFKLKSKKKTQKLTIINKKFKL